MQRSEENESTGIDEQMCLRCGSPLVTQKCKLICTRCGYTEDCSDAGLIDYDAVEVRLKRRLETPNRPDPR